MLYGTWPLCADCAAEHEQSCKNTHVPNYDAAPGQCIGKRCLRPNAPQVAVPMLCVSPRAGAGTLEEIQRRRAVRQT